MDTAWLVDLAGVWLTVIFTLAIYSFLYRDNPFYKAAEHLYVGVAAGYTFYLAFRNTIFPNLVQHLFTGVHKINAGDGAGWQMQWRWGALVLGLLVLARLIPKVSWISRWPMALVVGAFAGLNLLGYAEANLADQIAGTMVPLFGRSNYAPYELLPLLPSLGQQASQPSTLNHLVLVVGVISVLTYFFFSRERSKATNALGTVGIWFVMITFGATYGSIVLARISLLIGRVYDLMDYNQPQYGYPFVVGMIGIVAVLAVWRLKYFKGDKVNDGTPGGGEGDEG
ncbi:hypothetical protein CVU37_05620 [candidate division BRC1 bacterium HGW-BRC1-1]|nr:MAG: hypothetical protein CVU37_05620 [candidate division BRC1 bacterium HGW-BRC1-1]